MSSIKHSAKYPDSTIGTIFKHRHLPIKSLLHTFGFQTLIKYQKTFKSIYPCNGGDYFSKAVNFFYELEHDELTFFYSPIISSIICIAISGSTRSWFFARFIIHIKA